jgi:uncharacterized membrane protein YebE (DUF533 family)
MDSPFLWFVGLTRGDWVGIIGGLIALAALIYSVFTNFQSKEIRELNKTLERRAKSIDLEDIRNFCDDIADKMAIKWKGGPQT